jgi:hypothetical protein
LILTIAVPPEGSLQVESAQPLPALTARFQNHDGWTGGDGAQSIPLGPDRTLWLFGDTWIGCIDNGRRAASTMVNNSAAWQDLRDDRAPLRFFWGRGEDGKPAALLRPDSPGAWYWPGDGAVIHGRLYLFCKVLRRKEDAPPGFQFDWVGNDLLRIDDPQAEPDRWRPVRLPMPESPDAPRLGVACVVDGEFLYAYGLLPAKAVKPLQNPVLLARTPTAGLAAGTGPAWDYWSRGPSGQGWSARAAEAVTLFPDGAAEFTVSRVRGIPGLVATYTPLGLGGDVAVRHAPRPEGPWGPALKIYRCPEAGQRLLLYAAKAHPELATADSQLVITYCRNVGDLAEHVRRPDIYFPQAVEVRLRAAR